MKKFVLFIIFSLFILISPSILPTIQSKLIQEDIKNDINDKISKYDLLGKRLGKSNIFSIVNIILKILFIFIIIFPAWFILMQFLVYGSLPFTLLELIKIYFQLMKIIIGQILTVILQILGLNNFISTSVY